jgi:hypothetical protein
MGLGDLVWIVYTHCRSLRIHDGIGNKVFANKFAAGSFARRQRLPHKKLTLEVQVETLPRSITRCSIQE